MKRFFDIVVSSSLLAILSPVMAATAIAVAIESPGPIIYKQARVGKDGKNFTILKFRSMRSDSEKSGRAIWAQKNDCRITKVGEFIRSHRIDELPQLINVLRGEMSLIGPRPERPEIVETLEQEIPLYNKRATVKPGITGLAQVRLPYGASVNDAREKLVYDLEYIETWNMLLDFWITLLTVRVVLFRQGAR